MARTVYTTTISLPKSMAFDAKERAKKQGKTFSEYIRYTLELAKAQENTRNIPWEELRAKLKRISTYGRQISGSDFIAEDRYRH